MLSSTQTYLVYTPFALFLGHGAEVELAKRKGSLQILKVFNSTHLNEIINYLPGYLFGEGDDRQVVHPFRVELQGYESRRFKQFFISKHTA